MTQVSFRQTRTEEFDLSCIFDALEEQTNLDRTECTPPLHNVVNVDALGELFAPTATEDDRAGGQVVFRYLEFQIIIDFDVHEGNTWIRVLDADT